MDGAAPVFSEVNSTPLGIDDLFDVTKELNLVSSKWRSIGIALRLKPNTLDGIEAKNIGEPSVCLTAMVTEWLKMNYNVSRFGEPTWQRLVEAVGDSGGGANMALARDMARRHKAGRIFGPSPSTITYSYHPSLPSPSLEPAVVQRVTYSPPYQHIQSQHLQPQTSTFSFSPSPSILSPNTSIFNPSLGTFRPSPSTSIFDPSLGTFRPSPSTFAPSTFGPNTSTTTFSFSNFSPSDFSPGRPEYLQPQANLQWKRCTDMPSILQYGYCPPEANDFYIPQGVTSKEVVGLGEEAFTGGMGKVQAVLMEDKVYIGAGITHNAVCCNILFQYDPSLNQWSHFPSCDPAAFAMAQFMGNLITVGGQMIDETITGRVYRFNKRSNNWEEFITPMPTPRFYLSVATTQFAIVASGGVTGFTGIMENDYIYCATVEVYSSETSQWHTTDPLPLACMATSSVTIADTWYQLGGFASDTEDNGLNTVFCASLTSLIRKATSRTHQSPSCISVWKTLPNTPFKQSAAASLRGSLLAVGGLDDETSDSTSDSTSASPAVHVFVPSINSWVKVTNGNLPERRFMSTAVQLSSNQVLVICGKGKQENIDYCTKTLFLGQVHL